MIAAFPITIWTAKASPKARAIPKIIAVKIPPRAAGKTTRWMVCHRVAPRPAEAWRCCLGTACRASMAIEVIVGMIIRYKTPTAATRPKPVPPTSWRTAGTITVSPTSP